MMRSYFYQQMDQAFAALKGEEVLIGNFAGEVSDFVRLSQAKVRQAGTVTQQYLTLRLINTKRCNQTHGDLLLTGNTSEDRTLIRAMIGNLREQLNVLPPDPYLNYVHEVVPNDKKSHGNGESSRRSGALSHKLIESQEAIGQVCRHGSRLDLVGIYAAGALYRGFANSFGQKNWHESQNFNLNFSVYLSADRAVKSSYAGTHWNEKDFTSVLDRAKDDLAILERPQYAIKPGQYRVYLAPAALREFTGILSWGGYGLKARQTKQTPWLKLVEGTAKLDPRVKFSDRPGQGLAPNFNEWGFVQAAEISLLEGGTLKTPLVSARSAIEYGTPCNGAHGSESPETFTMAPGTLETRDVLKELDTGIYINNLWYLNYSDRPMCRVTGMTRFAAFWVEQGQVVAPIPVMRFDVPVLEMLGPKLLAITNRQELFLSASTYGQRSTSSDLLPGILVDDFALTL